MFIPIITSLLATLIPTLVYVYIIWWSDRYEREPGWLLGVVFLWGAIPAIILSVVAEVVLHQPFAATQFGLGGDLIQVALISPVVEEIAKGLALLGLVLFVRSEIDDVLDGIVYGALIGFGFAMTENFFYFIEVAFNGGAGDFLFITFLRAILFGLNHAFYTAITGVFVGIAVMRPGRSHRWRLPLYGLFIAMVVHGLHNLTARLSASNPLLFLVSIMLDWGGVFLLAIVVILAWKQEKEWLRKYLGEETPDVLSEAQYALVLAHTQRLGKWPALLFGKQGRLAEVEAQLHRTATELAFRKHRLAVLGDQAAPTVADDIATLRKQLRSLARRHAELSE